MSHYLLTIVVVAIYINKAGYAQGGASCPQPSAPAPLNTNATVDSGNDFLPELATDSIGRWMAVWYSTDSLNGTIGPDHDILFATSADNGSTWTNPAPVNSNAASDTAEDAGPSFANASTTWIVVWNSLPPSINDSTVMFSRTTDAGSTWSSPQALSAPGHHSGSHLATDGKGIWISAWPGPSSVPLATFDIFFVRSVDDGVTWSSPQLLNTTLLDHGNEGSPRLAVDALGNWLAVWAFDGDLGGININSDDDLMFARSDDGGATWTTPVLVNTTAATDVGNDEHPRVYSASTGEVFVVWHSNENIGGQLGTDLDLLIARSSDGGATWTPPQALNSNATQDTKLDFWV